MTNQAMTDYEKRTIKMISDIQETLRKNETVTFNRKLSEEESKQVSNSFWCDKEFTRIHKDKVSTSFGTGGSNISLCELHKERIRRQSIWNGDTKPTFNEKELYDELGDHAAVSVSLEDVYDFFRHHGYNASVHYDDYDEYGCEHYVMLIGANAKIKIEKEYGGMYFRTDYLRCLLITNTGVKKILTVVEKYLENFSNFLKDAELYLSPNYNQS